MNVNNGNSLLPEDRIEEFKSMLSEMERRKIR